MPRAVLELVRQRRLTFERIADLLGELELDFSFSVEATADLGMLIPFLRVDSYHNDLYESMNLAHRVETTSHMLARLRNAIAAELASGRASRTAPTTPAAPGRSARHLHLDDHGSATLFGFFWINAAQVAIGIYLTLAWQERRQTLRRRRETAVNR